MSFELTLEDAIADWAAACPESIPVFERLGLDYCCGGKSFDYICQHAGLDPLIVIAEIQRVGPSSSLTPGQQP